MKEFLVYKLLPFVLDHHNAILTTTWIVGAIVTVYLLLSRWWKEDAHEAALMPGARNESIIYDEMQKIARLKRAARLRTMLFRVGLWPFFAAQFVGSRVGKVCAYPFLYWADRSKAAAVNSVVTFATDGRVERIAGAPVRDPGLVTAPKPAARPAAAICCQRCNEAVPPMKEHRCSSPQGISRIRCNKCGDEVAPRDAHRCSLAGALPVDPKGDYEEDDEPDGFCDDCDVEYHTLRENHVASSCPNCNEDHCTLASCAL